MDALDGLPLAIANGIGVGALLVLLFLMLASGRLYTRGQVEGIRTSHRAELERMERAHEREVEDERHDKGEWRAESRLKDQTISELNEQNQAMLRAFGPTLTDFLHSLRAAGFGSHRGGGDS